MRLFFHLVITTACLLLALVRGDGEGYPEGSRGIEFLQLQAAASLGEWFTLSQTSTYLRIERAAILRTSAGVSLCDGNNTVPLIEGLAVLPAGEHYLRVCGEEAEHMHKHQDQHGQDDSVYICIDC